MPCSYVRSLMNDQHISPPSFKCSLPCPVPSASNSLILGKLIKIYEFKWKNKSEYHKMPSDANSKPSSDCASKLCRSVAICNANPKWIGAAWPLELEIKKWSRFLWSSWNMGGTESRLLYPLPPCLKVFSISPMSFSLFRWHHFQQAASLTDR